MPSPVKNVRLFRGWDEKGKHVWSPFVVKLEARLRFAGLPYTTDIGSPRAAPNGKIPYVEYQQATAPDGVPPTVVGDSTVIAKRLTQLGALPDLNSHLSVEARAQDLATRALLEDKLCFYHARERWMQNYYTMRDHVLWSIPYPIRIFIGQLAYRNTVSTLHGQGTGRFSDEQLRSFRREIWETINGVLVSVRAKLQDPSDSKERPPFWFLGGSQPTEVDTTLFGFITSVMTSTAGPESRDLVGGFPVILDYAERIHDRYFPDYQKWQVTASERRTA